MKLAVRVHGVFATHIPPPVMLKNLQPTNEKSERPLGFWPVPVDSGYFALMGIKELFAEVEEIKQGTNPDVEILGYLLTLADSTNIANEAFDTLVTNFGSLVFETKIRRSVKLREAPAIGKTIFHRTPLSTGAIDYTSLARETLARLGLHLSLIQEVSHEQS